MFTEEASEAEQASIRNLASVLEMFMELRANIPVHQIVILLRTALDEGHSQKYYSEKLGYPTATISRAMLDLGKKLRTGEPGSMLIDERPSVHSLREHEMLLTAKGRAFLKKVAKRLCA